MGGAKHEYSLRKGLRAVYAINPACKVLIKTGFSQADPEVMSKFNTPQKMRKYLSNMYKIAGEQCANNHYAKVLIKKNDNCWSYRLHKPDTI